MRAFLLFLSLTTATCMAMPPEIPTVKSMPERRQAHALEVFISTKKFLPERLYPGAPNEQIRSRCEAIINSLATELLAIADKPDPKSKLLDAFKATYPAFENADTEERERALGYFEELMDIFEIGSSDGLLDRLLYGFNHQ